MKKILTTFVLLSLAYTSLYSQNKAIKGRVITTDFERLPYLTISINDTIEVGKTDSNGFFKIHIPYEENVLFFDYIGLESATIFLAKECDNVEVIMMYDVTYDFISLKRIDRKRKKRFNKLEKLHYEAYEKGIFEAKESCFDREFIPFYSNK